MIRRSLKEVEGMCGGWGLSEDWQDLVIEGVSTDTRSIDPGQLFIPIKGENFNGHDFITMAQGKGAVAALWDKNEERPKGDFPLILVEDTTKALQELAKSYRRQMRVKVIGITGSNGKTSTKDILASLLKTQYKTHKTKDNYNNYIGLPTTILEMEEDTEMAVLEMGMDNFGQIELLSSIAQPDAAIITNIGEAHLEGLITPENIAKAKLEILKGLKPNDLFLYYGDDSILKKAIDRSSLDLNVQTYGREEGNDYEAEVIFVNEKGDSFNIRKPLNKEFFIPMLGEHQVLNATAAIAVAEYFGVSLENIERGLLEIEKTSMRNEILRGNGITILNDSYKSNPSSLRAALETMYSMEGYDQKIVVLGDMQGLGAEEIKMHRELGSQIDPEQIDYIFTYGPLSQHIGLGARENFPEDRIVSFNDFEEKDQLIDRLKEAIRGNALVLTKGSRLLQMEEVAQRLQEEI